MNLSIVIPCYNESDNLKLILNRFKEVIDNRSIEVIVVDNGSTDNTSEILDEILINYPFTKRVKVEINKGYGYGILYGLKFAKSDYVGWTHADMQTDPLDVIKAYDIIYKNNNRNIFVKGNRKGRPIFDNIFTFGMSLFETIFFRTNMFDINAQPNIFPYDFYKTWENPPYDFALDLYAFYMAKINHLKFIRFNVSFPKRVFGKSKWNNGIKSKIKFIKRTLDFSFKLKKELDKK